MKKIFVSLLFLLILTGCSSKTKDEEVKLVPYKEIVNNELKIVNMDKEEIYLSEYKLSSDKDFLIEGYTYVDFENDGVEELVIKTNLNNVYLIFHYDTANIYVHEVEFNELKKDGKFLVKYDDEYYIYSITFNGTTYELNQIARYNDHLGIYKLENKDVTKEKIKSYKKSFDEKESIKWDK